MIKNALVIALLGTCVTSSSFAFNIFPDLKSTHKTHSLHTKVVKNQDTDYTDFSGTWSGSCSYNGESDETTIIIRNDEVSIELDGEQYSMGAIKTESTSDKMQSFTSQAVINWNQERTQLNLSGTMTVYEYPDYPYNSSRSLVTMLSKGSIALNNKQLIIKVEGTIFDGTTPSDPMFTSECTLDKVK